MRTGALSLYSVAVITATLVAEALLAAAVALGVEAGVDDDGAKPRIGPETEISRAYGPVRNTG